jgi:hypothetical protein
MTDLLNQLIEATDSRTVDRIIEKNIWKVDAKNRTFFCLFANRSKRRIQRVNAEKTKSWKVELN